MTTPYDRLLKELFGGEETDQVRDRTLQHLLNTGRRRRQRRATTRLALQTGAALLTAGVAVMFLVLEPPRNAQRLSQATLPVAPTAEPGSATSHPETPIHYLSDEDLLSLFPDRPGALLGRPGDQVFLFLDRQPWR